MCRFGPIIGILIRAGLLFFFSLPHLRCGLRAHRAAEGPHGSTLYPPLTPTSLCNGHTWEMQRCTFGRSDRGKTKSWRMWKKMCYYFATRDKILVQNFSVLE